MGRPRPAAPGPCGSRRPRRLDGPINGDASHAYVDTVLVKTLKPDNAVALDNLGNRKGAAIRKMIRENMI